MLKNWWIRPALSTGLQKKNIYFFHLVVLVCKMHCMEWLDSRVDNTLVPNRGKQFDWEEQFAAKKK